MIKINILTSQFKLKFRPNSLVEPYITVENSILISMKYQAKKSVLNNYAQNLKIVKNIDALN